MNKYTDIWHRCGTEGGDGKDIGRERGEEGVESGNEQVGQMWHSMFRNA